MGMATTEGSRGTAEQIRARRERRQAEDRQAIHEYAETWRPILARRRRWLIGNRHVTGLHAPIDILLDRTVMRAPDIAALLGITVNRVYQWSGKARGRQIPHPTLGVPPDSIIEMTRARHPVYGWQRGRVVEWIIQSGRGHWDFLTNTLVIDQDQS
jgi:hypothetical protein